MKSILEQAIGDKNKEIYKLSQQVKELKTKNESYETELDNLKNEILKNKRFIRANVSSTFLFSNSNMNSLFF